MEYVHVKVRGGAHERGRQYGKQVRDRVRRSVAAYREAFRNYTGWDWPRVIDWAVRSEHAIDALDPKYLNEMRGIAEGAQVDYHDILAINLRTEILFAATVRDVAHLPPAECSAFAVLPARSADGHALVGQNWDWLLHAADTVIILEAECDDGPNFVTVVEAGLLAKTGMNSAGIGLVTNALVSDADRGEPGLPYHVLLRAILDAESLPDALQVLQSGKRSSAANFLIAHRESGAVDIEAEPGELSGLHLVFPDDGLLVHTNHFTSAAFAGTDVTMWIAPSSPFRLERLTRALDGREIGQASIEEVLRNHLDFPSGICCHPDPRVAVYDQKATICSVIMDLTTGRLRISDGPPCSAPYRELEFSGLLGRA